MVSEGDGFVGDAAELAAFADALSNVIADPFDLDGEAHVVDLAIGVAAGPPNMIDDVRLAEEVEGALAQSRNDHAPVVRDLSQSDSLFDALALRRELPGAIERGEMFLQYQPKVHVRRQEVASAEALVRWRHPTRGLILPGDFIPLAEIAIDDYGAGLSSLAYLKQLPARELKIDKMFVLQLTSSNRDPLIVRSTIDLAHALEMEVTAEGVETPAALALLSVMGCDMIQGYLISRPLEIEAFRHYMRDHKDAALVDTARATFRAGALRRVG